MIDIKLTIITEIEGPEKKRIIENVYKFQESSKKKNRAPDTIMRIVKMTCFRS